MNWTYNWAIRNIFANLIMPPGLWIIFGLFALVLLRRRKKLQFTLLGILLTLIWITSTSVCGQFFYQISDRWMKWPSPIDISSLPVESSMNSETNFHNSGRAIVILGGGIRRGAKDVPQYGFQDISPEAMERLRMGARLAKKTGAPILVTGGRPDRNDIEDKSEGELMAQILIDELQTKVSWIENQSQNTQENAYFSAKILKEHHVQTIYLVTQEWHIPRATYIFQKSGLTVIPAPVGFIYHDGWTPLDFVPSNDGYATIRNIWHESLGQVWFRLQNW